MNHRRRFFPALLFASAALAACGGGGGGYTPPQGPPGSQVSSGPSPTPTPTATPTATPTPQFVQFSGTVTQLAGSLAHGNAIPASPAPTPVPGAPVAGAHVYVTTADGIFTSGTPNPVLAQATTAPDGTFTTSSLDIAAFNGRNAGIVVIDGSSVSAQNGLTDQGFAVLHTQAAVAPGTVAVPNLEIDTLTAEEAAGAAEIETVRANHGVPPSAVDEAALETVRWSVQNDPGSGASQCGIAMTQLDAVYASLGGQASVGAYADNADTTLSAAVDAMYQSPSGGDVWTAAAGPANAGTCGSSYSQLLTVSGTTIFR